MALASDARRSSESRKGRIGGAMKVGDLLREASFPGFSMERWRELAHKALGSASFEDALVSHTDDGIRIDPLSLRVHDARPFAMRAKPTAPWAVTQRIDDPDPARANRQALEDVEQGATGLALVF